MAAETPDRRAIGRFDMRLPAAIRIQGETAHEFHTETQNVSARGVFFYFDRMLPENSRIEVTLTFPPHVTLTDAVRVRFEGRVVRSEPPLPSARIGIAAEIENYEFLRASQRVDYATHLVDPSNRNFADS